MSGVSTEQIQDVPQYTQMTPTNNFDIARPYREAFILQFMRKIAWFNRE